MTSVPQAGAGPGRSASSGTARGAPGGADHAIDGVVPSKVLAPDSVEGIRSAVEAARAEALTMAPAGGRTRLGLGNPPRSLDLMVDVTRVNQLIRHTPADLTASAEAGITISQLQQALAEHGQFLAVDPPLPDRATLGGTVAVGFSGPMKWLSGNVRDCVIGMTVVQADGNITRSGGQVVKNVSGYDLARMHVGALGTLGIVAEVSLKLTPMPRREATLLASFDSTANAWQAGLSIFRSVVTPLALTVYDQDASRYVESPDTGSAAYLAVRLGGRPLAVDRQARECAAVLGRHDSLRVDTVEEALAPALWRGLADFGYTAKARPYLLARAMVKPSHAAYTARALAAPCPGLRAAVLGQPAHGTVNVGWYEDGGPVPLETVSASVIAARRTVEELGGRLVIERCGLDLKEKVDAWGNPGPALQVMRNLKRQFDPENLLNPGRYVGGI